MMYGIITKCPECCLEQIAEKKSIGRMLTCAKCRTMFKCKMVLGPYPWAKPVVDVIVEGGFKKAVTKVVLTYGVAIPPAYQDSFIAHLGRGLTFNEDVTAKIKIAEVLYDIHMVLFRNKHAEPTLHMKWGKNEAILTQIRMMFPEAYNHYCEEDNRDFLPGNDFVVCPDSETGVFALSEFKFSNETTLPGVTSKSGFSSRKMGKSVKTIGTILKGLD